MKGHVFLQQDSGVSGGSLAGAYLRAPEQFLEGGAMRHVVDREALATAMRSRYAQFGLTPPESLNLLAAGAPTWTAGHQLVAAGGPAFFHYKILSMVRRARLRGDVVVPVFWLASEDHDWGEVRHFPAVKGAGMGWAWPAQGCSGAVGRWALTTEARKIAADWAAAADLPATWRVELEEALAGSATLAEATFRLVHGWFGDDGVVVLDADDPQLKALAAPLWEAELAGRGIGEAVGRRTEALESAGWHPGLHPREVALFELRDGARVRLERFDEGVRPVDGAWGVTPSEAAARAREARWSPNAALRPIYQEWLLGNEAVFLGPSELAYWLQLTDAFAESGVAFPRLELRDGGLAVEPEEWEALQAWGWHPGEGAHGLEERWNRACAAGAAEVLPSWDFDAWADAFAASVVPLDATLEGAARAAVKKMEKAFDAAAGKVRRAWRLKHADEEGQVQALVQRIAPGGVPQERVEHVAPLAEALGGWSAFKAAWCAEATDAPVFIVWVAGRQDASR